MGRHSSLLVSSAFFIRHSRQFPSVSARAISATHGNFNGSMTSFLTASSKKRPTSGNGAGMCLSGWQMGLASSVSIAHLTMPVLPSVTLRHANICVQLASNCHSFLFASLVTLISQARRLSELLISSAAGSEGAMQM